MKSVPGSQDVDVTALLPQLREWAAALGFSQIGVADVDLASAEPGLLAWLPPARTFERLPFAKSRFTLRWLFIAIAFLPLVLLDILAYLLACIGWLVIRATCRYLLRAENEFRIVPVGDNGAEFWLRQINLIASFLTFGSATVLSICPRPQSRPAIVQG